MEEQIDVKTEEYFESNPWSVEDASVFLKYCCPECDYQIIDFQLFSDHALENHSKSSALFGESNNVDIVVKEEPIEFDDNANVYTDPKEETVDYSVSKTSQDLENSQKAAKKSLKSTIDVKRKKTIKKFYCNICAKSYSSYNSLNTHNFKYHKGNDSKY